MAEPLVLTYNLDATAAAKLDDVCKRQGVRIRAVALYEYALPVGALAGIPVSKQPEANPVMGFSDPMLVMCHMLSPQLDAFLQGLRDGGVPRVALKAILTPFNVAWSSIQLHDELVKERDEVEKRSKKK